jgi:competence protein ComEC
MMRLIGLSFALLLFAVPARAEHAGEMRLHLIDVGQGEAILLEFSCGAALIDTGGESNEEFQSTDALLRYLDDFFERRHDLDKRLDLLVLSHPHIDHTRGVKEVLARYKPRNIVTDGLTTGSGKAGQLAARKFASDAEDSTNDIGYKTISVEDDLAGDAGYSDGVVDPLRCSDVDPQLRALWGAQKANPGWPKAAFSNVNNHSVVMRLDFGKASFLFPGDLEQNAIAAIVDKYRSSALLDVDVLKVGHHGADNALTAPLVEAVSPKMAVLSMGPSDREEPWTAWAYGHPRKKTIDLLVGKVSGLRAAVTMPVASAVKKFAARKIEKAIYATGWEGTVVLRAKADGTITIDGAASPAMGPERIHINTASVEELMELPSLGPRRAKAITTYRGEHGAFATIADLRKVAGIGPATYDAIRDRVTVD